jgi:hypothetical protein
MEGERPNSIEPVGAAQYGKNKPLATLELPHCG